MLKRGDKGPAVRELQQMLIDCGYPLPRWGADGGLGTETIEALARCLHDHGMTVDEDADTITDDELARVKRLYAGRQAVAAAPGVPLFSDQRQEASNAHDYGRRPWTKITGICLHQTACLLGERPGRWNTVGCHLGITRAGRVIWLHDFDRLIVHGNGWNTQTIGIEIDGLYAGVDGDPSTVWNDPDTPQRDVGMQLTPEAVYATQQTVRWICSYVASHGGRISALVAHRQASKNRQDDPGSAIWQQVALPLHAELGLGDGGRGFKLGSGYPIPEEWNPAYKGTKY